MIPRCWLFFVATVALSTALRSSRDWVATCSLRQRAPLPPRVLTALRASEEERANGDNKINSFEVFFTDGSGFGGDEFVATSRADVNPETEGTYGELLPEALRALFKEPIIQVANDDVVYDLGSGVGKIVAQFAFETNCRKAIGVELGKRRHELASEALSRIRAAGANDDAIRAAADKIQFISADLLDVPWDADATILFINAFCFPPSLMQEIERRVKKPRPPGSHQLKYVFLAGQRFRHDMTTAIGGHYIDLLAPAPAPAPEAEAGVGDEGATPEPEDEEPPGLPWPFNLYALPAPMTFSDETEVQLYVSHAQMDKVFSA